jgi:hypothetical protein
MARAKPSRTAILTAVRYIVAAVLLLAATGCGHSSQSTTSAVPNVVGLSMMRAFRAVFDDGLCVGRVSIISAGLAAHGSDRITRQAPRPGLRLRGGGLVSMTDVAYVARLSKGHGVTAYGVVTHHSCPAPKVRFAK